MEKITFVNYPNTTTPIDATNMNDLQNKVETAIGLKLNTSLKAIGTDVTVGTEDTKYVTSKAIKDANVNLGAWTAWTPTVTNGSVGNGTITGRYVRIGKTVSCMVKFVLGSTSTVSADFLIAYPVVAKETIESLGTSRYFDTNTAVHYLGWWRSGYLGYNGITYGGISNTVPFTWAVGDIIWATITYEAA